MIVIEDEFDWIFEVFFVFQNEMVWKTRGSRGSIESSTDFDQMSKLSKTIFPLGFPTTNQTVANDIVQDDIKSQVESSNDFEDLVDSFETESEDDT